MKLENMGKALDEIREGGRFRKVQDLRMVTASKGVRRDGSECIVFNSNDYLGMTHEQEVQEAARDAVRWGTGSGGARLTSGAVFELSDLEKELASFKHAEDAVIFNTGYMTNLGVLYALAGPEDVIFSDALNHASIVDGCRISKATVKVYPHSDMKALEKLLHETETEGQRFIVTDGVFSMGGDIANLPEIVKLAKEFGARVMVDDAHGLGVIGVGGRGTASHFGLEDEVDIYMGTFSKSLASLGGYMASTLEVAEYVRHSSRPFIFSASMTPASCAAALAALRVLEREPERVSRLQEICRYVRAGLTLRGIPHKYTADIPIIPIYTYETIRTLTVAKMLYEAGVYVNPVLPPATPATECLLRTSYMATLKEPLLDEAMDIMASVLTEEAK